MEELDIDVNIKLRDVPPGFVLDGDALARVIADSLGGRMFMRGSEVSSIDVQGETEWMG